MHPQSSALQGERNQDQIIVRHIPFDLGTAPEHPPTGQAPVKEFSADGPRSAAREAESFTGGADMAGQHVLFVLTHRDDRSVPVVSAAPERVRDDEHSGDALMVFTRRESAVLYQQIAHIDYRVESIIPQDFTRLLRTARGQNVEAVLVDPNRRHQEDGRLAGNVIWFEMIQYDLTGENVFQEIFEASDK